MNICDPVSWYDRPCKMPKEAICGQGVVVGLDMERVCAAFRENLEKKEQRQESWDKKPNEREEQRISNTIAE